MPQTKAGDRPRRSILLVEDHGTTAEAIFSALSPANRVTRVSTLAAAHARIAEGHFDAAFVSLAFPNHAGMRFITELKRRTDLAIIAIVRGRDFFAANYQTRMATLMGANGTLVKPISAERTQVVLDQAMALWAAQTGKGGGGKIGVPCRSAQIPEQRRKIPAHRSALTPA